MKKKEINVNNLSQEEALSLLITAVHKAYKNNCYTMEESAILLKCIQKFTSKVSENGKELGEKIVITK